MGVKFGKKKEKISSEKGKESSIIDDSSIAETLLGGVNSCPDAEGQKFWG